MTVLVDGNNVMGASADGWWRDPAAAARRLVGRLQRLAPTLDQPLVVVFDVPQADLAEGEHDGITVRYATRRGRDAADERILDLVAAGDRVVTSDRALAEAVGDRGATVVGAGAFLARLPEPS